MPVLLIKDLHRPERRFPETVRQQGQPEELNDDANHPRLPLQADHASLRLLPEC